MQQSGWTRLRVYCNSPKFPVVHERAKQLREQAIGNRYALLTGSKDFNLPGTKEVFEEWKALAGKLGAFVKAWPGTAAAARAEQELQKMAPAPK